jgi:hypothetical protein
MRVGVPSLWAVLVLPFVSFAAIEPATRLTAVIVRHNLASTLLGVAGLVCFVAAMAGLLPPAVTSAAAVCGGVLAGLVFFAGSSRRGGDDSDTGDWGRGDDPPDGDPPPGPGGDDPVDWAEFDRLRAEWARGPRTPARC